VNDPLNIPIAKLVKDRPQTDVEQLRADINRVIAAVSERPRHTSEERMIMFIAALICVTVFASIWVCRG